MLIYVGLGTIIIGPVIGKHDYKKRFIAINLLTALLNFFYLA